MKVVALVSGGKDSCYAMMKCIQYGHQVSPLPVLVPLKTQEHERKIKLFLFFHVVFALYLFFFHKNAIFIA